MSKSIRERREELGMTRRQVASATGLTENTIANAERSPLSCWAGTILQICDALKLDVREGCGLGPADDEKKSDVIPNDIAE